MTKQEDKPLTAIRERYESSMSETAFTDAICAAYDLGRLNAAATSGEPPQPRCPECKGGLRFVAVRQIFNEQVTARKFGVTVECQNRIVNGKECDFRVELWKPEDFAEFFSPSAPQPCCDFTGEHWLGCPNAGKENTAVAPSGSAGQELRCRYCGQKLQKMGDEWVSNGVFTCWKNDMDKRHLPLVVEPEGRAELAAEVPAKPMYGDEPPSEWEQGHTAPVVSASPATSRTYGDLPGSIRNMVEPHEWDNKNISEQRDYALDMVDFLERELGNFRRNQAAAQPVAANPRDTIVYECGHSIEKEPNKHLGQTRWISNDKCLACKTANPPKVEEIAERCIQAARAGYPDEILRNVIEILRPFFTQVSQPPTDWAKIALAHITSKAWDDEFIEQQEFESYLGWLIKKLEGIDPEESACCCEPDAVVRNCPIHGDGPNPRNNFTKLAAPVTPVSASPIVSPTQVLGCECKEPFPSPYKHCGTCGRVLSTSQMGLPQTGMMAQAVTPVSGNGTEPPDEVQREGCHEHPTAIHYDRSGLMHCTQCEAEAGAASHNGQGWVRVEDRKPATSGIYEVIIAHCGKEEYRDGARFDPTLEEEWTFSSDPYHGMMDLEVSRWRDFGPLPAPPSEEADGPQEKTICGNCEEENSLECRVCGAQPALTGKDISQAWNMWTESEEGKLCSEGTATGEYLQNRLWRAFMAGQKVGSRGQGATEEK